MTFGCPNLRSIAVLPIVTTVLCHVFTFDGGHGEASVGGAYACGHDGPRHQFGDVAEDLRLAGARISDHQHVGFAAHLL